MLYIVGEAASENVGDSKMWQTTWPLTFNWQYDPLAGRTKSIDHQYYYHMHLQVLFICKLNSVIKKCNDLLYKKMHVLLVLAKVSRAMGQKLTEHIFYYIIHKLGLVI